MEIIKVRICYTWTYPFNFKREHSDSKWTLMLDAKIKKWGSPSLFLTYKSLKLKLRVFLAGHIVAMVAYSNIDRNILSNDWADLWYHEFGINQFTMVIMTPQNLRLGKCWKLVITIIKVLKVERSSQTSFLNFINSILFTCFRRFLPTTVLKIRYLLNRHDFIHLTHHLPT